MLLAFNIDRVTLNKTNLVIVIGGPTASGKSQLAMDMALSLGGAVVNADAMQMYKNTPIISACPTAEDKAMVEHCLYEVWDVAQNGSVVEWLELANAEIRRLWAEGKVPVVVGGTGMYIDNLINGQRPDAATMDDIVKRAAKVTEDYGANVLVEVILPQRAEIIFPSPIRRPPSAHVPFMETTA